MTKRKITEDEFQVVGEALQYLTEILLDVGIVELKISKKEASIFWDTEDGGQISPDGLEDFSDLIETYFHKCLTR